MLQELFIPFVAISLAELLDKSQLSLLLLATRTKKTMALLLGAMLGFLIVDGLAVILGAWITTLIPQDILKLTAAGLFIIFGLLALRSSQDKPDAKSDTRNPLVAGFLTILFVEWGDKTQLATAAFATQFNPFIVFLSVMTALFLISLAAILLGQILATRLDKKMINLLSGVAFIIIGIFFLFS